MAIDTPQAIIALKCPSSSSDPRLDDLVELAKFYVAERTFLERWDLAIALVVCHWLTLEAQGDGDSSNSGNGAVGGISSVKEGDLERRYGSILQATRGLSEGKLYWMSTPAGQELMALWNACILSARTRLV